jgi:branched-chain amino acid transport system substrate-binding protein
MKRSRSLLFIAVLGCLLIGWNTPALAAKTIKIGVIGPMQFAHGKAHWNGATMAAEEINKKGGVKVGAKHMKIELVKADSNEFISVTDATNAMELLCTREKVDFVVGGIRTESVLAMQDVAMDYKKIFFGCGAADPQLCTRVAEDYDRYKYWFRGTPFNSIDLVKTCFMQMGYVGAVLKKTLGLEKVKVAIVAEKAMWTDKMVPAAEGFIPKMGMEVAGVWRPSDKATDVTAELSAVQRSGAHMILALLSGPVGIPFARQAGELKIPAALVGINVESQKDGFWDATQGMGNYSMTLNTYCQGVEYNETTAPFVDGYIKRFGETPTYNAGTYGAIMGHIVPAVEEAGTLDPDKLVPVIEKQVVKVTSGVDKYTKDKEGRHLHDLQWGPGYLTSLGVQWVDGKQVGVWPYKWVAAKGAPEITYKGVVPYKVAPWIIEAHKK